MNYAVLLLSRRPAPAKSGGSPAPVPRAGLFIWATVIAIYCLNEASLAS